jgi:ketosteroid isomerase-like protein
MEDRWDGLSSEIAEVRDAGEFALALGTFRGTGRESGVSVESPLAEVVAFREGAILSARDYLKQEDALRALAGMD